MNSNESDRYIVAGSYSSYKKFDKIFDKIVEIDQKDMSFVETKDMEFKNIEFN
jgi:hypothetical protein